MSMRDKAERDELRSDLLKNELTLTNLLFRSEVKELLDIADERDALAEIVQTLSRPCGAPACEPYKQLQAELTQEQNATQEWRGVSQIIERECNHFRAELEQQEIWRKDFESRFNEQLSSVAHKCQELVLAGSLADSFKEELERLRNSVPRDVERLLKKVINEPQYSYEHNLTQLKALIGSLIEPKRKDLEEAYCEGAFEWGSAGGYWVKKDAKAYADRKMKEGNK